MTAEYLPPFEDPRAQAVYHLLCDGVSPPDGDHWEGWMARRIVAALFYSQAELDAAAQHAEALVSRFHIT